MNLGQTCFFNVILQALASCQSFCDWIAKDSGSLCAPPSPSETRFTPQANTGSDVRTLLNQIITGDFQACLKYIQCEMEVASPLHAYLKCVLCLFVA